MGSKFHTISAIVFKKDDKSVLLENITAEDGKDYFKLPTIKVRDGLNDVEELKKELKEEYKIIVRYSRILPDTWARLSFSYSRYKELLKIYYIFELIEAIDTRQDFNYVWASPDVLEDIEIPEDDKSAIEVFFDF